MKTLNSRLLALEAMSQSTTRPRLSVLVMRGPNEQAELDHALARGFAAELDTPENSARLLG